MHDLSRLKFVLSNLLLALILSACAAAPRAEDAAPLPEQLPAAPTEPAPEAVAETGDQPAQAPEPTTEPEAPGEEGQPAGSAGAEVITFNINGGIIGFCDSLAVSESGAYAWQSCRDEESQTNVLAEDELTTLQTWNDNLAAFTLMVEDNPGGPDNMVSELVFNGRGSEQADEVQQRIIFDWANGLLIRLFPQPEPPPTAEPVQIGPGGLCPEITRPAMLIADYDNPSNLILLDPETQARCDILLQLPPFGRIRTAAGHIYYPAFDLDQETLQIWQLNPAGEQTPLAFTSVSTEQFGPLNFVVSADGSKIAWGQAAINFEVEPPLYRNELWLANIDGTAKITLLEPIENSEQRFVAPLAFSPDNSMLYYALQPDGLDGNIFSFSGLFDNLYRVPASGGQGELLFACPAEARLCGGDLAPDGGLLSYADPAAGLTRVIDGQGGLVASLTPPATDYIGPALFGPGGNLALVSAALIEEAGTEESLLRPNPGTILLLRPPYTGQPETLLSDNSVATVWEWLDENRLAFGSMDEAGNIGTSILTLEGQVQQLSPNFPLAVLR